MFIYALGIMTDLYDTLYYTMMDPSDPDSTWVQGSQVYYHMQDFNRNLLRGSIAVLLLAILLFITNTDKRRKYYIANYVSTGLYGAVSVAYMVWGHINIQKYRAEWKAVDYGALKSFTDMFKQRYTESTFWFDIHYLVFLVGFVSVGLLVFNLFWKIGLMKEERRLVEGGKAE